VKRQADTEQWPVFLDRLSWGAGVLDAVGAFRVREREGDPYATTIKVRNRAIAGALLLALGGAIGEEGYWYCPAREQLVLLEKIIPYLRVNVDTASAIYRLRLVSPKRMVGWVLTPAVRRFRKGLTSPAGGDIIGGPVEEPPDQPPTKGGHR
jgi:hypothetical protein